MSRDKRTANGRRRYVRRVGDHALLLAACSGYDRCARAARQPNGVCLACEGAILTPAETHDTFSHG